MGIIIGLLLSALISAGVGFLFWGVLLHSLLSLIPQGAALAWLGNLFCVILVGWFGGIAFPIIVFIFGCMLTMELSK